MVKRNIAVIVPSLRPHKMKALYNSLGLENNKSDIQLFVISDYIPHEYDINCFWIKDHRKCGTVWPMNRGYIIAENLGYKFLVFLSDDCIVSKEAVSKAVDCISKSKFAVGGFYVEPKCDFSYFGVEFSPFPVISVETVQKLYQLSGGYYSEPFDRRYMSYYADPDLTFRILRAGGQYIRHLDAKIFHPHNPDEIYKKNFNRYNLHDREVFFTRWNKFLKTKEE